MQEQGDYRVAHDWEQDLRQIQSSPDYAARIAASEPGIAQIDEALAQDVQREDNDLIQLIERLHRHQA